MATIQPANTPEPPTRRFRLPDIPERHPDDMTSVDNLHQHGAIPNIAQYLGNPNTTIISAGRYVVPGPAHVANESKYPDLPVTFNADPDAYAASNGYILSEQRKPPDFVLVLASRHTAEDDPDAKKDYCERLGVAEYWRSDREGQFCWVHPAGLPAGGRRVRVHRSERS